MRNIALILTAIVLTACTVKKDYIPVEYEITNDRIETLQVKGDVQVINSQTDKAKYLVAEPGALEFYADYISVTEQLKTQLEKEIAENSKLIPSAQTKTIELRVLDIRANLKAFRFVSTMYVEYKLGGGEPDNIFVSHGTPGNVYRALNGTIAWGVIEILKQENVVEYLAK